MENNKTHKWILFVHSLTEPLDQRRVVASSRHHRSLTMSQPASALSPMSTFSCTPDPRISRTTSRTLPVRAACHLVGHLHGCWLPDEVLHTHEPILADDVRVCRHPDLSVCRRFCCKCLAVGSGLSLMHLLRNRVFQKAFTCMTSWRPQVSIHPISWGLRSSHTYSRTKTTRATGVV